MKVITLRVLKMASLAWVVRQLLLRCSTSCIHAVVGARAPKIYRSSAGSSQGKNGQADQALAYIQQLYRVEQSSKDKAANEKYQARQQQSQAILDKLKHWLDKSLPLVPPKTALGKALYYLDSQWLRLINYMQSGDYPIDNNAAENAIRPFVIGRKNWLFSASQQGATSSANLYSLIETAKANGLEPYTYLKRVFMELPNATTLEQIENLLPWNLTINE
jgi:transposase